ncbi:MAG: NfeD family protein [Leptolyngbyaceae cyanobacterium T60_A2020_046]|nr:NfeD family protein [Leptolyngbyaceae cyanobacterium T60_A2020_046]
MNLLKALFQGDVADAQFFENTLPLLSSLVDFDEAHVDRLLLAVVTEPIAPGQLGRVKFQGTRWRARCDRQPIAVGTTVRIIGRERSTILVVEPAGAIAAQATHQRGYAA